MHIAIAVVLYVLGGVLLVFGTYMLVRSIEDEDSAFGVFMLIIYGAFAGLCISLATCGLVDPGNFLDGLAWDLYLYSILDKVVL